MMFGRGYNGIGECSGYGFGPGYGFMQGLFGIIVMGALIVLTVVAIVYLLKRNALRPSDSEALNLLRNRLANGEITEEEYLNRKNILEK